MNRDGKTLVKIIVKTFHSRTRVIRAYFLDVFFTFLNFQQWKRFHSRYFTEKIIKLFLGHILVRGQGLKTEIIISDNIGCKFRARMKRNPFFTLAEYFLYFRRAYKIFLTVLFTKIAPVSHLNLILLYYIFVRRKLVHFLR